MGMGKPSDTHGYTHTTPYGQMTHPNEMAKAAIEDLFDETTHMGKCPDNNDVIFTMVAGIVKAEALYLLMVDEA